MRKNFGQKTWMYPMPVLMIGTYDENGKANLMNAAWGGIYNYNHVVLSLSAGHKTTQNIRLKGAFTISFADTTHMAACDYVGLVSGNKVSDKLEKAGFTTEKSAFVDAPIICELSMSLECKLLKFHEVGNIIGEIVNVSADECVLGEDGLIDAAKLRAIAYDAVHNDYLVLGEKVGNAFKDGNKLK